MPAGLAVAEASTFAAAPLQWMLLAALAERRGRAEVALRLVGRRSLSLRRRHGADGVFFEVARAALRGAGRPAGGGVVGRRLRLRPGVFVVAFLHRVGADARRGDRRRGCGRRGVRGFSTPALWDCRPSQLKD